MTDITHIFGGAFSPNQHVEPVEIQLATAMRQAGIEPPADIKIDGQLHRFSTKGRKKDDSGWYICFGDGIPAGRFGCWRDDIEVSFRADVGRELTAAESMALAKRQKEAKDERNRVRALKAEVAASTVEKIWTEAGPASPDHPYLAKKQVQPHGVRITGDGRLIVPLYSKTGDLSSLQYIDADGDKKYHPGGIVDTCSMTLGDGDGDIFIAEGFATAATVHEVTGQTVIVAFSASNLPKVAAHVREKYGQIKRIIIVADHDEGGIGKNYADQAAAISGARVVMPPEVKQDANDYYLAGNDLMSLLYPPVKEWLTRAKDFSAKPAPISWLVKRWLQDKALIMVHGPSGGGKTFIVLDWCLGIASAEIEDWHGFKVRNGSVVYLAGEGHHGLRGRVAAWRQHFGVDDPALYLSSSGCDLNTPDGYIHAAEHIRALPEPPRLIVVDTLHRFLSGDENSAQDAKTMLDACAGLMSEFSCSVLLVHHTGVSEEAQHRARGSSAWKGALENEISIVPGKNGGSIEIIQRKAKDAEIADPVYVDLQPVEITGWLDEDNEQVTSCVIVPGAAPVRAAKDSPVAKAQHTWTRAWFHTGAELEADTHPYISRSGLEDFFEKEGHSAGTIRNYLKPSYEKGLIAILQNADIIMKSGNGWVVINEEFASSMLLMRNG